MENKYQPFYIPLSIIIAGAFIALSITSAFNVFKGIEIAQAPTGGQGAPTAQAPAGKLAPLSENDHIIGNKDAKVLLVEYSDLECPFCKKYHETLKQVAAQYGDKIGWIYRHFPIDQLHSRSQKESEATECAFDQGGDSAFWKYTDRIFEVTESNNKLDPAELPKIAAFVGLDVTAFNDCLSSGKNTAKVKAQLQGGVDAGIRSTPSTFLVTEKGSYPLTPGAMSVETLKTNIDKYLNE